MMRGIDVSSHQGDIQVHNMDVDFVIAKATQGVGYVNPWCDIVVQRCISSNKKWGFYHFADDRNEPEEDADYFMRNCANYFGQGVPCLDWEELYDENGRKVSDPDVEWVNRFVRRVHEKKGVWPWIYANPWRFNQGGVEENCGRWIAQYPPVVRPGLDYELPDAPEVDGLVCCWQYASDGAVDGYSGNLDVDRFFGGEDAWDAYAGTNVAEEVESVSVLENDEYRIEVTRK